LTGEGRRGVKPQPELIHQFEVSLDESIRDLMEALVRQMALPEFMAGDKVFLNMLSVHFNADRVGGQIDDAMDEFVESLQVIACPLDLLEAGSEGSGHGA
jgi:hypothetical protein